MKHAAKWICVTLLAGILAAVYLSRTIENLTLTAVSMMTPFKGTMEQTDEDYRRDTVRVRAAVDLILEDVYIQPGDTLKAGDPVASVYPAAMDRLIDKQPEGKMREFLQKLRDDGYVLHAPEAGRVTEVPAKTDGCVNAEDILYKYIPEAVLEQCEEQKLYSVIVPKSALVPTSDAELFAVFYAVPLTGKGEEGQYQVIRREVRILDADENYAALDTAIWDGSQVITASDKPLAHMQKVKAK